VGAGSAPAARHDLRRLPGRPRHGPRLDTELRAAYWLAGASNALSGALLYHVSVLLDSRVPSVTRAAAAYAAREWVRVLRRADAFWS
jgi:hypothetical protein